MLMHYSPADELGSEGLYIKIALQSPKYERFDGFLTQHFARPDLSGRIGFNFYGFNESIRANAIDPDQGRVSAEQKGILHAGRLRRQFRRHTATPANLTARLRDRGYIARELPPSFIQW